MRKNLMILLALLVSLATQVAWAQTLEGSGAGLLLAPAAANQMDELQYHLAVLSSDSSQSEAFSAALRKGISERDWQLDVVGIDMYPDIVFIMDGDASVLSRKECRDAYAVQLRFSGQEKLSCDQVIKVRNLDDACKKVLAFLAKFYYSGMRPVYSTVFKNGEEGYNGFRIPSVLTLGDGRILALAEARGVSRTDCAENDIVLKYSDDEGRTWSKLVMVAEGGESSYNNPTSVYVEEIDRVIVLFQEYPPKLYEGSVHTGMEGKGITRCHMVYSDDHGLTWSEKLDITSQVKLPEAAAYASGPGAAIRVVSGPDKGRILVPVNVAGGDKGWFNYLFASDDFGKSWFIIPGHSSYGTNESQVVQVSDKEFVINARSHRYPGDDTLAPEGWNPWFFGGLNRCRAMIPVHIVGNSSLWRTSEMRYDLPDPVCQGAIYRYGGLGDKERSRLLFVNAASNFSKADASNFNYTSPMRVNGVVRISYDNGKTWSHSRRIYGNRFTEFQYSVLTRLESGKIGCLFEAAPEIRFAVFDLKWLTGGEDK